MKASRQLEQDYRLKLRQPYKLVGGISSSKGMIFDIQSNHGVPIVSIAYRHLQNIGISRVPASDVVLTNDGTMVLDDSKLTAGMYMFEYLRSEANKRRFNRLDARLKEVGI